MLDYLRAELYRLLHKKSFYIYFAAIALGYAALSFIRSSSLGPGSFTDDAVNFSQWLPLLVGGFLFAAVYTDELGSRSLGAMVGYGLGKTRIICAKTLFMMIAAAVVLAVVPVMMAAVLAAFGAAPQADSLLAAYALMFKSWMVIVAYSAVASVVSFASQRTTFAIVAYLFLSVGIVSGLVGAALDSEAVVAVMPGLSSHMASFIGLRASTALMAGDMAGFAVPLVEWIVYVGLATFVATVVFKKREMEF
jgi:hypothetical protein